MSYYERRQTKKSAPFSLFLFRFPLFFTTGFFTLFAGLGFGRSVISFDSFHFDVQFLDGFLQVFGGIFVFAESDCDGLSFHIHFQVFHSLFIRDILFYFCFARFAMQVGIKNDGFLILFLS